MYALSDRDQSALLQFLQDLYRPCDVAEFRSRVLAAVQRLIPCDVVCYDEVDVGTQTDTWLCRPADALTFPDSHSIFQEHISEHPLINYHVERDDLRVLKLSDFLSQRQLHDLGLYQDFFRHVGTEYQMASVVSMCKPVVIGLVLNRPDRDFTERERALLALANPHLIQAHRNAQAFADVQGELASLNAAVEQLDKAVIVLQGDGTIRSCSVRAECWLREYFGARQASRRLPEPLHTWLAVQQTRLGQMEPLAPLVVDQGKRLIVRAFFGHDRIVLILTQEVGDPSPAPLRALGLSQREAEVSAHVAEGRSNHEIGQLLGMSPRTVQKHLEHIFEKLTIESRTALATRVWRTLT